MKKIIKETDCDVFIEVPGGTITVISVEDKWILDAFPVWGITGSRSKYIFVERRVKTDYSSLRERIYLHRVIVKPIDKEQVDHKDRDRLNNRRSNLRICSFHQNMGNVAGKLKNKYKGVFDQSKYRKLKKPFASYLAYIDAKARTKQKRKYLGHFETAEQAAKAYDIEARKVYGEFAYLNFPDETDG